MITLPLLLIGACLVQGQDRLRDLAEKHGKFFGSALNYGVLTATSAPDYANYTTMSREQFSLSTAENACKWGATEPSEGHFDFAQCDKVNKPIKCLSRSASLTHAHTQPHLL